MARSLLPPQLRWPPTPESERTLAGLYPHRAAQIVRAIRAHRRAVGRDLRRWERARRADTAYGRTLRRIAQVVADLIRSFTEPDPEHPDEPGIIPPARLGEMQSAVDSYSDLLDNWARNAAERMIADVSRRDAHAWFRTAREIGIGMREISQAPIGETIRRLQDEQVDLIKRIPRDRAEEVQKMTQEYVLGGRRYDEVADHIERTEDLVKWKATLIATTETAKAQSAIVQARARAIGVERYIWTSVGDAIVRPIHKKLNGTVHSWSDPPVAEENGERHSPGMFPNCRCWATPFLEDILGPI